MSPWPQKELDTIADADEIDVAPGGSRATTISVVRVGDELYVRSYRGAAGNWFQRAVRQGAGDLRVHGLKRAVTFEPHPDGDRNEIDTAYRAKYGQYGHTYVDPMVTDTAAATTLRLVPR